MSTLLTFHQALVRGKYRRLFSSSARPKKSGPKGASAINCCYHALISF